MSFFEWALKKKSRLFVWKTKFPSLIPKITDDEQELEHRNFQSH